MTESKRKNAIETKTIFLSGNSFVILIFQYSHYEPPGHNVSIVTQISLKLVSNCLKRSQFSLKYVSDKMSQFAFNFRPF